MEQMKQQDLAKDVYQILKAVYEQSPWTYDQIFADMERIDTDYFFVYDQKTVVGFIALQQLIGEREITNLAVNPSYQRKGLGKMLLSYLDGIEEPIFLEVRASNSRAIMLYEQKGFKSVGKRKDYYRHPVEDALLMKRDGEIILKNDR